MTGPDCSAPITLEPGRHVIGRASTACLQLDDPALEFHHVLVTVANDATASVVQLAGRCPVSIDGTSVSEPTSLPDGALLQLGSTELLIRIPPADRPLTDHIDAGAGSARIEHLARCPRPSDLLAGDAPPLRSCDPPPIALGIGRISWSPPTADASRADEQVADHLRAERFLDDVSIDWQPQPASTVGIVGSEPHRRALARSIVMQLAIRCEPTAWRLRIETDSPAVWEWIEWLPNARRRDGTVAINRPADRAPGPPHEILIIDETCAPATELPGSTIVLADPADVPLDLTDIVTIGFTGEARREPTGPMWPFRFTGLGHDRARDLARQLALHIEPEQHATRHPVGGSPSSQRGPEPNPAAASSML